MTECLDEKTGIYATRLTFDPTWNHGTESSVTLRAVYQDTAPSGTFRPVTVVAMHGSPGSHSHFKFIAPLLVEKGIRLIGINFPGFGLSEDIEQLTHSTEERCAFVEALLDHLNISDGYIFFGHSRGAENALMLAAKLKDRTVAVALANPPGLRPHHFARRSWVLDTVLSLPSRAWLHSSIEYCLLKAFHKMGLKARSGPVAMNSIKTARSMMFSGKRPFLDTVNETRHIRVLCFYAGRDEFIATNISREYADNFQQQTRLIFRSRDEREEKTILEELKKAVDDNVKSITVEFERDGHFRQRDRPRFWAESIDAIACSISDHDRRTPSDPNMFY